MANTNDMNTPTKVPCGGFVLGEGLALGEDGKTLNVSGGGSQADWNQNDETAADYVKNRPFYTGEPVETLLMEETTVSFSLLDEGIYSGNMPIIEIISGDTYNICFDDITYKCIAKTITEGTTALGNQRIISASSPDTGEPFLIVMNDTSPVIATLDSSPSHVVSISRFSVEVKQIDEKYLPEQIPQYRLFDDNKIYTDDEMKKIVDDIQTGKVLYKFLNDGIIYKASYTFNKVTFYYPNDDYLEVERSQDGWNFANARSFSPSFIHIYDSMTDTSVSLTYGTLSGYSSDSKDFATIEATEGLQSGRIEATLYLSLQYRNNTKYARIHPDENGKLVVEHHLAGNENPQSITSLFQNGEDSLVLASSTSGSTKKFRITVDDTGTIKATEVTNN